MIWLYPTDTLFGLGADATDPAAIAVLRELKGSPGEKHISIVVADLAMMRQYAEVTPLAEKLAAAFLPGKLTLVLNAKNLPKDLSEDGTIGIRIPNHPVPLALVRKLGKPITATSANVSGQRCMMSVPEIHDQFGDKYYLLKREDEWPMWLPPSAPSTVVDARGDTPIVIREGAITTQQIFF
ncbi:MAG: L-threonylcarbamoyladenylate synthase [Patescibacteria group bacterium]